MNVAGFQGGSAHERLCRADPMGIDRPPFSGCFGDGHVYSFGLKPGAHSGNPEEDSPVPKGRTSARLITAAGATRSVLVMFGFLLEWPTILTLAMFPVLVFMYWRPSMSEERDAFGEKYAVYKRITPAFIPWIRQGRRDQNAPLPGS